MVRQRGQLTIYLCDTNVWIAIVIGAHVHHEVCQAWLDSVDEPASILFCRTTQQSLLRLLTTTAVTAPVSLPPFTNEEAWRVYETSLQDDRIVYQDNEPEEIERYWRQYSSRATPSPKLWMDAYLAAYARAVGYCLVTTDSGFRQFEGLDLLLLGAAR